MEFPGIQYLVNGGLAGICVALIIYAWLLSRQQHESHRETLAILKENAERMGELVTTTDRLVQGVERLVGATTELCIMLRTSPPTLTRSVEVPSEEGKQKRARGS